MQEYGRKPQWTASRYYTSIYLDRLRKSTKDQQDS